MYLNPFKFTNAARALYSSFTAPLQLLLCNTVPLYDFLSALYLKLKTTCVYDYLHGVRDVQAGWN